LSNELTSDIDDGENKAKGGATLTKRKKISGTLSNINAKKGNLLAS
jgi:hypothetical protein